MKEYLVTVTAIRKYYVEAPDSDYAADNAIDEACFELDDEWDIEAHDVEYA